MTETNLPAIEVVIASNPIFNFEKITKPLDFPDQIVQASDLPSASHSEINKY